MKGMKKNMSHSDANFKSTVVSKIRIREAIKSKFDSKQREHTQNLNEKYKTWTRMELISLIFSMSGLAIAIYDYERNLYNGSF